MGQLPSCRKIFSVIEHMACITMKLLIWALIHKIKLVLLGFANAAAVVVVIVLLVGFVGVLDFFRQVMMLSKLPPRAFMDFSFQQAMMLSELHLPELLKISSCKWWCSPRSSTPSPQSFYGFLPSKWWRMAFSPKTRAWSKWWSPQQEWAPLQALSPTPTHSAPLPGSSFSTSYLCLLCILKRRTKKERMR